MNQQLIVFILASVLLFQAPLATQAPTGLVHYFCDWDNLSRLIAAFGDGSSKAFSKSILGITSESPVSISFARDGFIYAGVSELFCPALRDLLSDAVEKGDRWSLMDKNLLFGSARLRARFRLDGPISLPSESINRGSEYVKGGKRAREGNSEAACGARGTGIHLDFPPL